MRLLFALLLLCATPAAGQSVPSAMLGPWVGTGEQPDGQRWRLTVDLGREGAEVGYPGIPCSARWTLAATASDRVSGVEHLTAGHELCLDGLTLRAALEAKGTLLVLWFDAEGREIALATLIRPLPQAGT